MLPLEGIMVVYLEQAVAAPFATRQLADLGAEREHTDAILEELDLDPDAVGSLREAGAV